MKTQQSDRSRFLPWFSCIACGIAGFAIGGLVDGRAFIQMDRAPWETIPFASLLGVTAVVGITWQQFRARARRRLLAALDTYAEREIRQERTMRARDHLRLVANDHVVDV